MKSILSMMLLMILSFGTAEIGVEVYKYYQVVSVFQDELGNLSMDAMELATDDAYRMEHILLVDEDEVKLSFFMLLINRYQLSDQLQPLYRRDQILQIHFDDLRVTPGSFAVGQGVPVQTSYPALYLKGYVDMKPLILNHKQKVSIPFELETQMKRVP